MLEGPTAEDSQGHLLRRVAARDMEALAKFYDQTAGALFSVAIRILGDPTEAEEVIQDVFVQIWDKAPIFDPALGSAIHWALSITRHRAIDRLRSRHRRARLLEEFQNATEPDSTVASGQSPRALHADEAALVRRALDSLPADQRQAIQLAFFEGQTHLEIAEALHQPLGTIKARIRRGMLKLRDSLQEHQ
jgi:RNA polymerase sigma-70 factor (ECF subfamily)